MLNKDFKVPKKDRIFIYNELYYQEKDRTYWFYVNRFADDNFYDIIKKDIDKLELEYNGDEFIKMIKNNLERI